jgi:hypothetical protein
LERAKNKRGIQFFTPTDLKETQLFEAAIYPSASLGGKSVGAFLKDFRDTIAPGKQTKIGTVNDKESVVAFVIHEVQIREGTSIGAIYYAFTFDNKNVHIIRILFDDPVRLEQYQSKILSVLIAKIKPTKSDRKKEKMSDNNNFSIPALKDIKFGGKFLPGIYEGSGVYTNNSDKVETKAKNKRYFFYPDGVYQVFDERDEPDARYGKEVTYDPTTGKLDLEFGTGINMVNHADANDALCYYGYDNNNKPFIYSRNYRGYGYYIAYLRYVGPVDRRSPEQEKEYQAILAQEKKQYRFVTKPGSGLALDWLEGIYHHGDVKLDGLGGATTNEENFICLKDGTIYSGFPCPLDVWDVSQSRRREPEKWGKWKRSGAKILAAWRDAPSEFTDIDVEKTQPGRPGQTLNGKYGAGSSHVTVGGGSYELRYALFSPEGTFEVEKRGGYGSSILTQTLSGTSVFSEYNDTSSSTSVNTTAAFIGINKAKKEKQARTGKYTIEGYAITIRFDDGRVYRQPFFILGRDSKAIWFGEETKSKG